jgi:hypothetical protein
MGSSGVGVSWAAREICNSEAPEYSTAVRLHERDSLVGTSDPSCNYQDGRNTASASGLQSYEAVEGTNGGSPDKGNCTQCVGTFADHVNGKGTWGALPPGAAFEGSNGDAALGDLLVGVAGGAAVKGVTGLLGALSEIREKYGDT